MVWPCPPAGVAGRADEFMQLLATPHVTRIVLGGALCRILRLELNGTVCLLDIEGRPCLDVGMMDKAVLFPLHAAYWGRWLLRDRQPTRSVDLLWCPPPTVHIDLRIANWSHWGPQLPIALRGRNVDVLSNDETLKSERGQEGNFLQNCLHLKCAATQPAGASYTAARHKASGCRIMDGLRGASRLPYSQLLSPASLRHQMK